MAVIDHRLQLAVRGRARLFRALRDEEARRHDILRAIEEYAVGGQSVAPGPSRLLVIGVEVRGHVVVDDIAHV
ncbi:hypothetical protein SDC9_167854 [bioreactor metagenome]|uniref:Uncharacterized protein n=1 Tax=bioreactor metagenome TaxID=1076179 RepID=A0A645G1F7_9ZZZZ